MTHPTSSDLSATTAPGTAAAAGPASDLIRVRGARSHNLQDVSVDIPKRRLTVFAGLSGSGKSTLAFGTIAAESRRLINETYSAFLQGFMPALPRPDVDELTGLTAAVVVNQDAIGRNARSTVGTATDAYDRLRMLFSRRATPHVGPAACFSFNTPEGMCLTCDGIGQVSTIDDTALVDRSRSLNDGAIVVPNFGVGTWYWRAYAESDRLDATKPLADYTADEWYWLMSAEPTAVTVDQRKTTYQGLVGKVQKVFVDRASELKQPHIRRFIDQIAVFGSCPDCSGSRLNEPARTAILQGSTIHDCATMPITDLQAWVNQITEPATASIVAPLQQILDGLVTVGLGYLTLHRPTATLSGGEAQRIKIVRHLGSALTDISYVFDEPTSGLHPHNVDQIITLLHRLRDNGNTVLVVEHKPAVITAADHVVELGPGAGRDGGQVTFNGSPEELRHSDTITGQALREALGHNDAPPAGTVHHQHRTPRPARGHIALEHVTAHNVHDVSVNLPMGVLTVVTGVAGSGKSTLIRTGLDGHDGVLMIDQTPLRGSRRSNPASYTGLLDPIRQAYARAHNVKPGLFSANSTGACTTCSGHGVVYSELALMADVATRCSACDGRRFQPEVLEYRLHGLAIDETLALTVTEARAVYTTGKAATVLDQLLDVGLPYLALGQPLTTLSGGERQRLKLAAALPGDATCYVLDEPSTGLHLTDTAALIAMLHRMVDVGRSVIAIEHNLAVMAAADWIIDIGPGAGADGGHVVFQGTPQQLITSSDTLTARHLRSWLTTNQSAVRD